MRRAPHLETTAHITLLPHRCVGKPLEVMPTIEVPDGLRRQTVSEHGGLTIEVMTDVVVNWMRDNGIYDYTLPRSYAQKQDMLDLPYFVPHCTITTQKSLPLIIYSEAYRGTAFSVPLYENTCPASISCNGSGYFFRFVDTEDEILIYLDRCLSRFKSLPTRQ